MNFRTIKIGKNLLLKHNNLNITIGRNYYCEKWIKQQEMEKLKQMDLISIETLNINKKDIFLNNQIKKISEQNNKIQTQNEKILSLLTNLEINTTNKK